MRLDLHRQRIAVETELAADLAAIRGDRAQIESVIVNLVANAIDAMSAVHGRPRRLRIRSERDATGAARISIEDSGEGLDPAHSERIFEPFFSTKPHGMGLGLAICRSIVEAHGGRLRATPNLLHGSVVCFDIPAGDEVDAGVLAAFKDEQ